MDNMMSYKNDIIQRAYFTDPSARARLTGELIRGLIIFSGTDTDVTHTLNETVLKVYVKLIGRQMCVAHNIASDNQYGWRIIDGKQYIDLIQYFTINRVDSDCVNPLWKNLYRGENFDMLALKHGGADAMADFAKKFEAPLKLYSQQ